MSARVMLGGRLVALGPEDVIASGGEATVYGAGPRAIKLWHVPSAARVRKVEALVARRPRLPVGLVAPEELVHDPAGAPIGFAMTRLGASWEPFALLTLPSWRRARGIGMAAVGRVVLALLDLVDAAHAAGLVVGDLSDQNVLVDVAAAAPVRLVDVDSMQLPGHPCEVATEAYLDPRLYGPDLQDPCVTADGRPRSFDVASDRYAAMALAFRGLTTMHPFGGTLAALPTLPRRAHASASVLRPEVAVPARAREAIDLLPDRLRAALEPWFERQERPAPPRAAIAAWSGSLLPCGCGLEIPAEKLPCPRCSALTRSAAPAIGAISATVVLEARGVVVAIAAGDGVVVAVAIEGGVPVLHRIRGGRRERHVLASEPVVAGWDVALSTALVAVAPRDGAPEARIVIASLGSGAPVPVVSTAERASGRAAFAVADDRFFRATRGALLAGAVVAGDLAERTVSTVVARRTHLHGVTVAGHPAVVALGRALAEPRWTLVGRGGTVTLEVPAHAARATVLEEVARGDGDGVAVTSRMRVAGRDVVRTLRFDAAGHAVVDRVEAEVGRLAGGAPPACALRGQMLVATEGGLVREAIATGAATRMAATEPFVERGAPVAPAPGGVLVAQGRVVRLLRAGP